MRRRVVLLAVAAIVALIGSSVNGHAAQGGAASLTGNAKINSPGIKFLPCALSCPQFQWDAAFTPKFAVGGADGWNKSGNTLPAASCGGNVHQSNMSVGGVSVMYTGVCVGLLCVGGGPWGTGAFEAELVFQPPNDQAAQCFNGLPGFPGDGFTDASYVGAASGATGN